MGLLDSSSKTVSTHKLIGATKDVSDYLNKQGLKVAKKPFEAYTGQRVAPLTGTLTTARDMALSRAANPADYSEARGYIRRGAIGWGDTDAATRDRYFNPYRSKVMDDTTRRAEETHATNLRAFDSKAASRNAFGNNRVAFERAKMGEDFERNQAELMNRMNLEGWNQATGLYDRDTSKYMQAGGALAGMTGDEWRQGQAGLDNLFRIGGVEQGIDQASRDADFQEWTRKNQYDWDQLQRLGIIGQYAPDETRDTTKQTSSMSPLQAAVGVGSMMMGMPPGLFGGGGGGPGTLAPIAPLSTPSLSPGMGAFNYAPPPVSFVSNNDWYSPFNAGGGG